MFLFDILFPKRCIFCDEVLVRGEKIHCLHCCKHYPYAKDAKLEYQFKITEIQPENIDIFLDYSYCKESLHKFKYGGDLSIGKRLGSLWAEHLSTLSWIGDIDLIVPISLHRKKLYKRGFNQSEVLGRTLSKKLNIPLLTNVIQRKVNNPSQIHAKNRWENVRDIFVLKTITPLQNKHVLIIDDVITTSATTNYFAKTLRQIPEIKVSFAYLSSNF